MVIYKSLENIEIMVFFDGQYILKAVKKLEQDSGQFLVKSITVLSYDINLLTNNVKISFQ